MHSRLSKNKGASLLLPLLMVVLLGMFVPPATKFLVTLREDLAYSGEFMRAEALLVSEWERLQDMTFNEVEASKKNLQDYSVSGYNIKFKFHGSGSFRNGKCGDPWSNETFYKDCHNVSAVVSKDGKDLISTAVIPVTEKPVTMQEVTKYMKHYVKNASYTAGDISLAIKKDEDSGDKSVSFLFNNSPIALHDTIELLGVPDFGNMRRIYMPFSATETGYFFLMNDSPVVCVDSKSPNGIHHIHILCTYHVGTYFFPVTKGDYLFWSYSDSHHTSRPMYFVPAKKQVG